MIEDGFWLMNRILFLPSVISQRWLAKSSIEKDGLAIQHKLKSLQKIFVPFEFEHSKKEKVIIWDDAVMENFITIRSTIGSLKFLASNVIL